MVFTGLLALGLGCRAHAGAPASPRAPEPDPQLDGQLDEQPEQAEQQPGPQPIAASTLQVAKLLADPQRFVDQTVELEVRLVWKVTNCTRSVPPSCQGQWLIVDANGRGEIELRTQEIGSVVICKPATSGLSGGPSPCPASQVMDTAQRYIVSGVMRHDAGGYFFEPGRFIRRGTPGGPDSVAEITFLAERFIGRELEIEAMLDWQETGCTNLGCAGAEWRLLDAAGVQSLTLRLAPTDVDVPMVCVKPPGGVGTLSPCPAGKVLDRAARYRLRGELRRDPGRVDADLEFTAVKIELLRVD